MNIFHKILLSSLSLSLLAVQSSRAQTADEVIAKYVAALGGKEKLQSIRSIYMEGVAVMQNGTEVDSKTWKVQGKLYRQEIAFGMGNIVVIVNPAQGWSSNPRTGGTYKQMDPQQVKGLQWELDCAGPLVDYAAKGYKVELAGTDTVNSNECNKVKLTFPSGDYITYSIDKKSGYVLRESRKVTAAMGGGNGGGSGGSGGGGNGGGNGGGGKRGGNANGEFVIDYNDYQKTADGYIFPYTIIAGGFGAKTSVEKLEVNKDVDVATLGKPAQ
jgi:uncharacterized membrane protein YgcG